MSLVNWAITAYRHTRRSLIIGQSNLPDQVERTGGLSKDYVKRVRAADGKWEKQQGKWVYTQGKGRFSNSSPKSVHESMLARAVRATEFRAGNCDEHACVAYKFLWENQQAGKLTGVDTVTMFTCDPDAGGDHVFLVLNRENAPRQPKHGDLLETAFIADDSILLDVWGRFVCSGYQLRDANEDFYRELPRSRIRTLHDYILNYELFFRCEFTSRGEVFS
jgi:hypothetical protein